MSESPERQALLTGSWSAKILEAGTPYIRYLPLKTYVSRKKGTLSLNSGFNMMNIFITSGKECVQHANYDKLHNTRGY